MTTDDYPVTSPMSVDVTVYLAATFQQVVFDAVGNVVETETTGVLTIENRRGIKIAKFARDQWAYYRVTAYSFPGDHVGVME